MYIPVNVFDVLVLSNPDRPILQENTVGEVIVLEAKNLATVNSQLALSQTVLV